MQQKILIEKKQFGMLAITHVLSLYSIIFDNDEHMKQC